MFRRTYQILTPGAAAARRDKRRRRARAAGLVLLVLTVAGGVTAAYLRLRPEPPPPANYTGAIDISGQDRRYLVHLPPAYDGSEPLPVVLVFHGLTQSVESVRAMTGFDALADEQNFITVYPEGFLHTWEIDSTDYLEVDDLAFVNAVLDRLEGELAVDTSRVYATGFSMGGHMTNRLACEMADRIAAFGPVAGVMSARLYRECRPSRPVPILMIHGTDDRRVPYERAYQEVMGVPETLDFWVKHDGCDPTPLVEDLPDAAEDGTRVSRVTFSGCEGGAQVVLYTIEGGGHTWPGGAPLGEQTMGLASEDIVASAVLWAFFQQYRLP